jgi:hypothetical protein
MWRVKKGVTIPVGYRWNAVTGQYFIKGAVTVPAPVYYSPPPVLYGGFGGGGGSCGRGG